ncbi:MAG: serine/threonine protein kinase [Elusimicrobia bacterium]|nr:serine/threonine protein kinase [Elusimicrobiota bacterium]
MVAPSFPLQSNERLLKESAEHHFVRPDVSLLGRLCHAYLTDGRLVLCEADYDMIKMSEKSVGGILHEFPLSAVEALRPGSTAVEPHIEFAVREPGKGVAKLVLYFRDKGFALGRPERLSERDEWISAVNSSREKLGLPALLLETLPSVATRGPRLTTAPDKSRAGVVLADKYEIRRHIGSGGMSLVYEGWDRKLERPVAVKMMRPDLALSGSDRSAFLREAKTSAALHHPFIVDIYEILEEDNEIYLIFEFVDGQTLQERLDQKGPFKAGDLKPILKYVCDALSFAHSLKVTHRDLKSSNIMLSKQGYAKVMDFGIARHIKDTASRKTKLDTSGTFPYMAPEQEMGKFDLRSDIFALGVTAYELLTGELPYRGPNFYLQKEKKERRPLVELAADAPGELVAAVDRCLEFQADDRFQSVADFARAIGEA